MKKVRVKVKAKTEIVEPLFYIGQRVMLKENLIIVEIYDIFVEKNKYKYRVFYPHLHSANDIGFKDFTFMCWEDEIEERPMDYDRIIFNAYVEYRHKYYELLERLRTPSIRQDY